MNVNVYENMKKACEKRETTITAVLRKIGRSDGNTGAWKAGKVPSLEIVMEMADCLHMSLDELVYDITPVESLSESQQEWLAITDQVPADKQEMCKDFLRTHIVVPSKYSGKRIG